MYICAPLHCAIAFPGNWRAAVETKRTFIMPGWNYVKMLSSYAVTPITSMTYGKISALCKSGKFSFCFPILI